MRYVVKPYNGYYEFTSEEREYIYDSLLRRVSTCAALGREFGVDGCVISRAFRQMLDPQAPELMDGFTVVRTGLGEPKN